MPSPSAPRIALGPEGAPAWMAEAITAGGGHVVPVPQAEGLIWASPRDANTVFVALNNWQSGDYKPYIVRSNDRGRTWTNISGNLPPKHNVWSVVQDHVNPNLLFAGTEFGVFVTVDGGGNWSALRGGMPSIQVRDMQVQRRETDLVIATFGRGFYILDDYSALREVTCW